MNAITKWILKELAWIRQRLEKIDVQWRLPAPAPYRHILIDGGNTLTETSQDGIQYYDGELASVPSAYDPNVTSTFTNGVGRGTLYVNGVAQDGYVLVINDDRGSFRNALIENDVIWVGDAVSVPVSGGGSVLAYPAA